jgi:hypothetical protein
VDIAALLTRLQESGLAVAIRDSLYIFPLLESVHVIGLAVVFGSIIIIDLRLLGLASTNRPFQRIAADVLKWVLLAFAVTAVTGALMFTTNATVYYNNAYFRAKMVLLALAGLNALAFELTARRSVRDWDQSPAAPASGRILAAMSIVVWIGVIFAGRMIGFTATRTTLAPAPAELNFEDLLGLPAEGGPPETPGK